MKKQFLFLAMITLAFIFAGTTKVVGQMANPYDSVLTQVPLKCITPKPLSGCTNVDALHPVQGVNYTYTAVTTSATDDVRWFVVNNVDLTSANDSLIGPNNRILASNDPRIDPGDGTGKFILQLGTNNKYNLDPDGTTTGGISSTGSGQDHAIDISWKYFPGTTPLQEVLLVAIVTDEAGCTNNIAVYRIIPLPSFTIDIVAVNDAGDSISAPGTAVAAECVSPIQSAIYASAGNTTPGGTLTVDYGENWVYFMVNGANYIDSWMPEFQITYANGTAPALSASWAYSADAATTGMTTWNTIDITTGVSSAPVIANATDATAGTAGYNVGDGRVPAAGGECIIVRVKLDWGTLIEHDQNNGTLTFAVNGTAYDGDNSAGAGGGSFFNDTAYDDLRDTDCTAVDFDDTMNYDITPRPQVEPGTPAQETKTGQGVN